MTFWRKFLFSKQNEPFIHLYLFNMSVYQTCQESFFFFHNPSMTAIPWSTTFCEWIFKSTELFLIPFCNTSKFVSTIRKTVICLNSFKVNISVLRNFFPKYWKIYLNLRSWPALNRTKKTVSLRTNRKSPYFTLFLIFNLPVTSRMLPSVIIVIRKWRTSGTTLKIIITMVI